MDIETSIPPAKPKHFCEKCNYGTKYKHLMTSHLESEKHKTGKRKTKPIKEKEIYKCDVCNYESINRNNHLTHKLNNHASKEERKKEFKYYCDKCDFGVFTESSMNLHNNSKGHLRE